MAQLTETLLLYIEKYASKVEAVYTPQQWYCHVWKAVISVGSRVEVTEMEQEFFRNYRHHLRRLLY